HELQIAAPDSLLYVPAGHDLQSEGEVAASVELYFPGSHSVQEVAVPYAPWGQSEQELEPVTLLNLPASHSMHMDAAMAPSASLNVPAPQGMHVLPLVAPTELLYVPA